MNQIQSATTAIKLGTSHASAARVEGHALDRMTEDVETLDRTRRATADETIGTIEGIAVRDAIAGTDAMTETVIEEVAFAVMTAMTGVTIAAMTSGETAADAMRDAQWVVVQDRLPTSSTDAEAQRTILWEDAQALVTQVSSAQISHVDIDNWLQICMRVGYKEKRAATEDNAEQANSPNQNNTNNERIQNDEREVDNPERQEAQAQDEGKEWAIISCGRLHHPNLLISSQPWGWWSSITKHH